MPLSKIISIGWISTPVARNVQVLSLSAIYGARLPPCCFTSKTLVELTLNDCAISPEPGDVCLTRLKKLHLHYNWYGNDEYLPNLLSGCPAIEDLLFETDLSEHMVCPTLNCLCCGLSSPVLFRNMKLNANTIQCWVSPQFNISKCMITFPRLYWPKSYPHIRFSTAVPSKVSISRWRNVTQLVEKLSNAKSLTFRNNASMKRYPNYFTASGPDILIATTKFHNLTKLEIKADWCLLTELLQSAYKLESLSILKVKDKLKCWREPKHLPKCLLSSLKYVSFRRFAGGEDELNMIRYILRHAKVLERIEINPVSHDGVNAYCEIKILEQISYSSRGSQICQLTFV